MSGNATQILQQDSIEIIPEVFPEDIECVIRSSKPDRGALFISNIEAAENPNTLQEHKIGAILTCAKGYELHHPPTIVPSYKYIPTIDHENCDISIHFHEAVDFIAENIKKTNVLAHCIAGVSRSVAMVLAYLIRQRDMTFEEAYKFVKSRRRIIHPNEGFIKQLEAFAADQMSSRKRMRSLETSERRKPTRFSSNESSRNKVASKTKQSIKQVQRVSDFSQVGENYQRTKKYEIYRASPSPKEEKRKEISPFQMKNERSYIYKQVNKELDEKLNRIRNKYLPSHVEDPNYSRKNTMNNSMHYQPERTVISESVAFAHNSGIMGRNVGKEYASPFQRTSRRNITNYGNRQNDFERTFRPQYSYYRIQT